MKKFLKKIPVYFTIAMILCCSFFVPASAASYETVLPSEINTDHVYWTGDLHYCPSYTGYVYYLPVGEYVISSIYPFEIPPDHDLYGEDLPALCYLEVAAYGDYYYIDIIVNDDSSTLNLIIDETMCNFDSSLGPTDVCILYVNSCVSFPKIDRVEDSQTGMFYQAFDMFADFIYGEGVELTAEQNMVLTILATTAVLFVIIVPFLIVLYFVKMFG